MSCIGHGVSVIPLYLAMKSLSGSVITLTTLRSDSRLFHPPWHQNQSKNASAYLRPSAFIRPDPRTNCQSRATATTQPTPPKKRVTEIFLP
jgi:hypothetical protein